MRPILVQALRLATDNRSLRVRNDRLLQALSTANTTTENWRRVYEEARYERDEAYGLVLDLRADLESLQRFVAVLSLGEAS